MSKHKKYIIEKNYKAEHEFSEIDFDLDDELGISNDDEQVLNISTGDKELNWSGESHPIKIDRLIKKLEEFKLKNKCEYVELFYHEDHIGYNLTALNINKIEEDDIQYKKYTKRKEKEVDEAINNRIEFLEKELALLKKRK